MVDSNDDWTDADVDELLGAGEEDEEGDATAETAAHIHCPYCAAPNEIALDPGGGSDQEYVEDCEVCCRPILMYVTYGRDGRAEVDVHASDS